jgi:SAM-dependent methyltransferase
MTPDLFMQPAVRVRNTIRGLLQSYGTPSIKRHLWNSEFSRGQWVASQATSGDCAYPLIEKYANAGSILDLGCGEGRAATELDAAKYRRYTGVDVSDVALRVAARSSETSGRAVRNRFVQSDIFSYVPAEHHDVILFMESIYYVPWAKIPPMLARYARYLTPEGVFIVRLWTGTDKYTPIADLIERTFDVIEKQASESPKAVVMVFRPSSPPSGSSQEAR